MPNTEISLAKLPEDKPVLVKGEDMRIVVIRSAAGVHAYEDKCPHAFWPLSRGEVREGTLECPGHGWEFSVETGKCLNAPAYCLNVVDAKVDGDLVRLSWDKNSPVTAATSEACAPCAGVAAETK